MRAGLLITCFLIGAGFTNPVRAEKPVAVATTSIIGDVVKRVAGDAVNIVVIMPPGADPHHYEPSAKDMSVLADASVVFLNGLGLESFMERQLQNAAAPSGTAPLMCTVSTGIAAAHHEHEHDDEHDDDADPHVWTDPMNVMVWVDNITEAMSNLLPDQAGQFRDNADSYKQQLRELDRWIAETVSAIPPEKRRLVTDHHMLHYFAARYHFEQIGMILPSYSTMAEPSARELANLYDTIREQQVRAIFIANSSNPQTAERLARDTGIRVVSIYSGTLGKPGSGVESYIDYMSFNTRAIADALRDGSPAP